jgi:hypothetical protein
MRRRELVEMGEEPHYEERYKKMWSKLSLCGYVWPFATRHSVTRGCKQKSCQIILVVTNRRTNSSNECFRNGQRCVRLVFIQHITRWVSEAYSPHPKDTAEAAYLQTCQRRYPKSHHQIEAKTSLKMWVQIDQPAKAPGTVKFQIYPYRNVPPNTVGDRHADSNRYNRILTRQVIPSLKVESDLIEVES